jgi:diguanylate cyclase (GGDEF)-like protein/PAS domain S-box-containing protein
MIGTHTDINQNKKQQEQLQRAQKTAKIGIWELNHLTQELEWSDEIYNIFNIDKKRFKPSYHSFINVIHPDDRDDVNQAFSNSLETKKPYVINHRLKMDDGTIKYVREQCDTDFDENGEPLISRGTVQDITELSLLDAEMQYEKNFISTIIESSNAVIAVIDSEGRMVKLNSYGEKITGYTQEEISEEPLKWKCLLPSEIQGDIMQMLEEAKKGNIVQSYQNSWISKSGEKRMFEWSNTLVKKTDGSMDYIVSIGLDITQNEEQKSFLDMLINSQSHMIILTDKYTLKYINEPTLEFFEFKSLEDLKEKHGCICNTFEKDDEYFYFNTELSDENWIDSILKLPKEKQIVSIYSKKEKKNKRFQVNINNYGNDELYIVTFIDISETMQVQSELDYKSKHDPLTNIYNRGFFNEHHHSIINANTKSNYQTALAIIDIDHFKSVNDTYGHDVGDVVLKSLVELIQTHSRDNDVLVRWGGEEFILLMPINTEENLLKKLEHLREVIEKTDIEIIGNITVSMGATFVTDAPIDESIKKADTALYISKNSGRNKVSIN